MRLIAAGHKVATCARMMGCDPKTYRNVFSREERDRPFALLIVRSGMMDLLAAQAERGNVGAIKHLDRMLDAERMRATSAEFADSRTTARAAKLPAKGLKQQRRDAAWDAGKGDDEWGPLLGTPARPDELPN